MPYADGLAVTQFARTHMWLGTPQNLTVTHADARTALAAEPPASHDVIVGDAFHDIAVPPHLVTRDFMALVRSRLKPHGIYVMNVIDHAQRPRFALSIVETLKTLYPVAEIWSDATPDANERRATFVIAVRFAIRPSERQIGVFRAMSTATVRRPTSNDNRPCAAPDGT